MRRKISIKILILNLFFISQIFLAQPAKNIAGKTTVLVYMAADNDLFPFAGRNLKQAQNIGSNENLNIVVNLDMHRPDKPKITKRLFIANGKTIQIGPDLSQDSGNPQSLITFCEWAVKNYPAENYVLVLWNHGTGDLEPVIKRAVNPSKLFSFNPETRLIELDRSTSFMEFIAKENEIPSEQKRGICFDDTTGNFLTTNTLSESLDVICKNITKKKFSIIFCDACLMSMTGFLSAIKDHAEYHVGSQEVELGTGADYALALNPFLSGSIDTHLFAVHLVNAYEKAYQRITNDYTHSAVQLNQFHHLEDNMTKLSHLLIAGLKIQKNKSLKEIVRLSKHKNHCTHFEEPTYIDLGHFLENLQKNISHIEMANEQETHNFRSNLNSTIQDTLSAIKTTVIANCCGKNLKNATGISIYFPETTIHQSYKDCKFAINTGWINFLMAYQSRK